MKFDIFGSCFVSVEIRPLPGRPRGPGPQKDQIPNGNIGT